MPAAQSTSPQGQGLPSAWATAGQRAVRAGGGEGNAQVASFPPMALSGSMPQPTTPPAHEQSVETAQPQSQAQDQGGGASQPKPKAQTQPAASAHLPWTVNGGPGGASGAFKGASRVFKSANVGAGGASGGSGGGDGNPRWASGGYGGAAEHLQHATPGGTGAAVEVQALGPEDAGAPEHQGDKVRELE